MSLEEAVPTLEELRAANIEQVLAAASEPSCWAYANALLDRKTLPVVGSADWKSRVLVGFVVALKLDVDADAEPFKLGSWFGTLGPTALTKEQLDVLAAWVAEIKDPELRARVTDLLWMTQRPRNHLHGRAAIAAYVEAAERHLRPDGHWPHAVDAFARALALPSSFRGADFVSRLEAVLDGKYGPAEGPRDARLMRLMLDFGVGDAAKYAPLAEAEAERNEKKAESETYATNLSLMFAREFWMAAADWRARERGPNDPSVQAARLRAAETHIKEADKARDANQPLVEAHFLSNAITALRRVGGDRSRTEQLIGRMMEAQRTAPRAPITTNVNLTTQVADGRRAVQGKDFEQALRALVIVTQSPTMSSLREMATEYLATSVTGRLFPAVVSSNDSRVVAHMPPVSLGDDGQPTDEAVLRWHMHQQAGWIRVMSCGRILGARQQLELEHNPRIADLMPLVHTSALVPAGHEGLFAKGLHAGLHGDFVTAVHILIPQLENGLRVFIEEVLGRPMVAHDDDGTQAVNLFKRVLTHPDLVAVLGEDMLFDLQGLLIAQESTNLRNNMSHGLLPDRGFGFDAMYAWWLCLRICLGLVPARPNAATPPDPATPSTPVAGKTEASHSEQTEGQS